MWCQISLHGWLFMTQWYKSPRCLFSSIPQHYPCWLRFKCYYCLFILIIKVLDSWFSYILLYIILGNFLWDYRRHWLDLIFGELFASDNPPLVPFVANDYLLHYKFKWQLQLYIFTLRSCCTIIAFGESCHLVYISEWHLNN